MLYFLSHILISLLIGLVRFRQNRIEGISYGILCLMFPIGGYFIAIFLMMNVYRHKAIEDDFEDEKLLLLTDRMIQENRDVVAIEDFLTFGNVSEKRKNIIDVLKRDSSGYIDKLKLALSDEDSETAHYAASAITEYKRKIDLQLQSFTYQMEQEADNLNAMDSYLKVLNEYMDSNLLDDSSKRQYQNMALDTLYKASKLDPAYHKSLVDLLIAMGLLTEAGKYSKQYLEISKTADAYLTRMKYLYATDNREDFDLVFQDLKTSNIKLDKAALNILRFWLEDTEYVKF